MIIPVTEVEISTSRSGGPGGQHVNKTSSRVTLRWNVQQSLVLSEVQKNEKYSISVWVLESENKNSNLVVSANDPTLFYSSISNGVIKKNGWIKLELKISISEQLHNKDLKIYCWNSDLTMPSYFDDLEIVRE